MNPQYRSLNTPSQLAMAGLALTALCELATAVVGAFQVAMPESTLSFDDVSEVSSC